MPSALILDPHSPRACLDAQLLASLGYQSTLVPDLASALQRLATQRPDLILVDGSLEHKELDALFCQIRRSKRLGGIPVLSLVGDHDLAHLGLGLDDPLHACLLRPLTSLRLAVRLKELGYTPNAGQFKAKLSAWPLTPSPEAGLALAAE